MASSDSSESHNSICSKATLWTLRVTVSVQCLGIFQQTREDGTPVFSLLWGQPDVGGFGLSEVVADRVVHVAAWALLAAIPFVLARSCWPVLLPIALWHLLIAVAATHMGGAFLSQWTVAAHAVRIAAPIGLMLLDPWPKRTLSPPRLLTAIWILRLACVLTFVAHGWEAYQLHPQFVDYLIGAGNQLPGVQVSQSDAEATLQVIGVIDLLLGAAIVTTRWPAVAFYMAFWGLVTAFSRIVYAGWDVQYETWIRAANAGVPLAVGLYWMWRPCSLPSPNLPASEPVDAASPESQDFDTP